MGAQSINFVLLLSCLINANAWKTCDEVPFCKRIRNHKTPGIYSLASLNISDLSASATIINSDHNFQASLKITSLENEIFRVKIDDHVPPKLPRYSPKQALINEPKLSKAGSSEVITNEIILKNGKSKAVIYKNPFRIEIYTGKKLVSIVNAKQRLVFEKLLPNVSVALDFKFPAAQTAYGLPLHADHLKLRTTTNQDPYRLFNVDNYGYKVESTESLYGSVPVLYAHGTQHTSGVFWLNSAQTWIDLEVTPKQVDVYFISETGVIDAFILTGPTLPDTVIQYTKLTGTAPLPQYFTLGYHQSRYSYMSQDEVKDVVEQFNLNSLPVDVVWLDIDYTMDKKYFTWDPVTFSDPIGLQNYLIVKEKRLVAIIDPHIKNQTGYFVHDAAFKKQYYIRNPDGSNYVGQCWPGPSAYLDFTNQGALNYYASLYETTDTFQSKGIHIWNDMNEPAVFYTVPSEEQEYEKTIPLDRLHYNNYEHRDVHNIYGHLQTIASRQGMLARPNNTVRPFILTRSHFAGTQRYAAIWTGDGDSTWKNLRISFPMCITEALAGISFCGADVGGFVGVPSDELYQRWYQAAAWLPFYRGHSALPAPRREPYMFSSEIRERIRRALKQRYAHMPVWYTLFYEHEVTGEPVIRPMTYHYPEEIEALNIDSQLLIGSDILAAPILTNATNMTHIYLPGGSQEIWYNIDNNFAVSFGTGYHKLSVNIDSVPVFYRGGGIIFRKDTPRLSSIQTYNDPITAYIVPNIHGSAKGRIYVDDYETFGYRNLYEYVYSELTFSRDKVTLSVLGSGKYKNASSITKLIILNSPKLYKSANMQGDTGKALVTYSEHDKTVIITNISLKLNVPCEIVLYE